MISPRRTIPGGFTLVELMIAVAITGILASVALPHLINWVRRSHTVEATMNLRKLYDASVSYRGTEYSDDQGNILQRTFPPTQADTPGTNTCCGQNGDKCAPNPDAWRTPTWEALSFSVEDPHYYWYATEQAIGDGTHPGDRYDLKSQGNLNCDAVYSLFMRSASVDSALSLKGGSGLFVANEIE